MTKGDLWDAQLTTSWPGTVTQRSPLTNRPPREGVCPGRPYGVSALVSQ